LAATLHVLRVFADDEGEHGNPLGVFLRGAEVPEGERQRVAADLGFSETVFVDDPARGSIRIYTPALEMPFAGHPSVGTAWLLAREGSPAEVLRPPAGEVAVRREGELTYISARPEWAPELAYLQLPSAAAVEALEGPPADATAAYLWAWADEDAGAVRSRAFFDDLGIAEDEATGAAAIVLCARLGRALAIRQGAGSLLHARPLDDGRVEVGGRVVIDQRRDYEL
jgi:predicted PhzF superfamily epimerase YddE/YHI9